MNSPELQLLVVRRPHWFEVGALTDSAIEGVARVTGTRWALDGLALRCWIEDGVPWASEAVPGTEFPYTCPERHIQSEGVFCTGLDRAAVRRTRDADQWWLDLEQYLRCQSTATEMGIWPLGRSLDHGTEAGRWHQEALRLAAELGIADEYLAAYMDRPSWITARGLRLLGGKYAKAARGHRKWRPRITKPAKNSAKLFQLVRAEFYRRKKLKEFWDWMRASGAKCCGQMRDCPLQTVSTAASSPVDQAKTRGQAPSPLLSAIPRTSGVPRWMTSSSARGLLAG